MNSSCSFLLVTTFKFSCLKKLIFLFNKIIELNLMVTFKFNFNLFLSEIKVVFYILQRYQYILFATFLYLFIVTLKAQTKTYSFINVLGHKFYNCYERIFCDIVNLS